MVTSNGKFRASAPFNFLSVLESLADGFVHKNGLSDNASHSAFVKRIFSAVIWAVKTRLDENASVAAFLKSACIKCCSFSHEREHDSFVLARVWCKNCERIPFACVNCLMVESISCMKA